MIARLLLAGIVSVAIVPSAPVTPRASKEKPIVGSCTFPRSCAEYDAAKDDARRRCEALGARWTDAPCPEANVVATCTNAWDEGKCHTKFYPPTTRAEAAALCKAGKGEVR